MILIRKIWYFQLVFKVKVSVIKRLNEVILDLTKAIVIMEIVLHSINMIIVLPSELVFWDFFVFILEKCIISVCHILQINKVLGINFKMVAFVRNWNDGRIVGDCLIRKDSNGL